MNPLGEYWQTLGRRIDEGLGAGPPEATRFAEVATEVLRSVPAPAATATAIADWMIEAGSLPEQVNLHSGFGEPPLVVFQNERFYLEVLFWFPGRTAMHGHGFGGAFLVLDGLSVQVEFDFRERAAPEEGVRLGELVPRSIEFIAPGKVCTILPDDGFIHSVTHLGQPSLTLVARTYGGSSRSQFRYHRCGFAVLNGRRAPQVRRQAEVLAAVHDGARAEFPARFARLLESLDDCQGFALLEALLGVLRTRFAAAVVPILEAKFAESRPHLVAAIRERVRTQSIWANGRGLPSLAMQVRCALADVFPDAAERHAVLCRSYGVATLADLPQPWRDLVGGSDPEGARPA